MADIEGYTIKDRIAILADTISTQFNSIIVQLDKIESKLDGKASNERVAELEKKLADLELRVAERLTRIESRGEEKTEMTGIQRIYMGFGVTVFSAIISTLVYLAVTGVH